MKGKVNMTQTATHSELLDQLKAQMQAQGLSMHELARRSGVTYDTIRRVTIGECDTVTSKYESIAKALGLQAVLVLNKGQPNEQRL